MNKPDLGNKPLTNDEIIEYEQNEIILRSILYNILGIQFLGKKDYDYITGSGEFSVGFFLGYPKGKTNCERVLSTLPEIKELFKDSITINYNVENKKTDYEYDDVFIDGTIQILPEANKFVIIHYLRLIHKLNRDFNSFDIHLNFTFHYSDEKINKIKLRAIGEGW